MNGLPTSLVGHAAHGARVQCSAAVCDSLSCCLSTMPVHADTRLRLPLAAMLYMYTALSHTTKYVHELELDTLLY